MRFPKTAAIVLTMVAASFTFSPLASTSHAENISSFRKTYKVQIEYWRWTSDHLIWLTAFETTNRREAEFVYNLLLWAKENGRLNDVAPNASQTYIAVDVRMIIKCDSFPIYEQDWHEDLLPMDAQPWQADLEGNSDK